MAALEERFGLDSRSAILCGCVAALFLLHALYLACVAEDAYISFHYAQNLVAGHGFVWNVGEPPVEGYTNFLWLLLCAGVLALGLDLPLSSQVFGLAAGLLTLVYVYRAALMLGGSARSALLPALALACSGPFAAWSTSGMETSAFALFVTVAIFHASRFVCDADPRDLRWTVVALVLATLTRPEGLLIAVSVASVAVFADGQRKPLAFTRRRAIAAGAGVYVLVIAAFVVWRWNYFGYPLPNSFYAKTGGGLAQAVRGAEYAGLFALHFVLPWVLSAVLGLVNRAHTTPGSAARSVVRLCAAGVVPYVLYIALVGGDYMAMYRFFVPVLPALYLLIHSLVLRSMRDVDASSARGTWVKVGVLLGLAGTLFHSTPLESEWVEKPDRMHGNYRGIQTERWYVARHRLIGEFFARYGRPSESLATGAVGAVAFGSGLAVYDVHGVVDSHIAHEGRARGELGSGLPGHEKTDYPYIFDKQPTFYMFSRKLREQPLAGMPLLVPEVDARVAREYRVGSVFLEDSINGESGYFSFLERRDREPRR